RLGHVRLRDVSRSPDGGVIADYLGEVDDPAATAARLSSTTGLIEHGLCAPALVSEILVARGERVERITTPERTGEVAFALIAPGQRCAATPAGRPIAR
ncbi:MAG: hypothetical protein WAN22_34100, partial [Solirubrobacteraceae bacterium]